MHLSKEEVLKILEVMEKFPEADCFELKQDTDSGIGSITTLTVFTEVNGIEGHFIIEISGIENW
jgi:hypothetical protein